MGLCDDLATGNYLLTLPSILSTTVTGDDASGGIRGGRVRAGAD